MDKIKQINSITKKLNNLLLDNNTKIRLRDKRKNLMKEILKDKNFDKNKKSFLLPHIKPDMYISYNTAVVGNSINLINKKYGTSIDQHEDIIRFNYAPTKNYENYCGSKNRIRLCSYLALTGKKPDNHPPIDNMVYQLDKALDHNKIIVFYKKPFHLKTINKYKDKFIKKKNSIHTILWDPKYFNDVLVFNGIKPMEKHPQCGTGMMLLLVDLNIIPDIYGIDTKFSKDNYFYYWDDKNKKCENLSTFHNYDDEFRIPKELAKNKLISLY